MKSVFLLLGTLFAAVQITMYVLEQHFVFVYDLDFRAIVAFVSAL